METLKERIKRHEGYRGGPYRDTKGKLTIGYGRNLDAKPLLPVEGRALLAADIRRATLAVEAAVGVLYYARDPQPERREAIIAAAFLRRSYGMRPLDADPHFCAAVKEGRFATAATRCGWAELERAIDRGGDADGEPLTERLIRMVGFAGRPFRRSAHRDGVGVGGPQIIGYGRNLDADPLSETEAAALLDRDIADAAEAAERYAGSGFWHSTAPAAPVRRDVLTEMAYQMGAGGLAGFVELRKAVRREDWDRAAAEMLDSDWARKDSPSRAHALAEVMLRGYG